MNQEQPDSAWGRIVAKAWADANFKKRLFANPTAVLKEHGLEVAPGIQVKVVEDTDTLHHLSFPPKPSDAELSEEELSLAAGGIPFTRGFCRFTHTWKMDCEKQVL